MDDARKVSPDPARRANDASAPRPPLFVLDLECGELYVFPSTTDAAGWLEAIDVAEGNDIGFDADGRRLRLGVRVEPGRWGSHEVVHVEAAEEAPSGARELADILRRGLAGVHPANRLDDAPLATLVALAARERSLETGVIGGRVAVYTGHRRQADIGFPMAAWLQGQEDLAPLEPLLASLARELGVQPLGNEEGKYPWPSRGVRWRRGFDEHEVRVSVSPRYHEDEQFYYVLSYRLRSWAPWFFPFHGVASYTETKGYTPDELRSNAESVLLDLRALVLLKRS